MNKTESGWKTFIKPLASGQRCRHLWPQALVYDPIWPSGKFGDIVRLTCPLLVQEIDKYEREGAIGRYNERLRADPEWQEAFLRINSGYRDLRKRLVEGREEEVLEARRLMGSKVVDILLETGITGMSLNSTDVKCFHAHVADELTRGGNAIGRKVLEDLVARGVNVNGTGTCCDHCNVEIPLGEGRWTFYSSKNHLRRRMRKLQQK